MKKTFILSLALTLVSGSLARADLAGKFAEERLSPSSVAAESLTKALLGYHVVFIGIRDKLFAPLHGFSDNASALTDDLGVSDVQIIPSQFFESYDANAALLSGEITQAFIQGGKKPLIVIGNPQSGPFGLYALLKNPALFENGMVAKIILIQPAFGSPLVDEVTSSRDVGKPLTEFVRKYFGTDLQSFRTDVTRALFSRTVDALTSSQKEQLGKLLYFVRAAAEPGHVTPWLEIPYFNMRQLRPGDATDGISSTDAQKLDSLGNDLGVLSGDHWNLFATEISAESPVGSITPAETRKAFTRALLREVLQSDSYAPGKIR